MFAFLTDVIYSYGRKSQTINQYGEIDVYKNVCKWFIMLEFPLLFLSFMLHPKYGFIEIKMVDSDVLNISDIVQFVSDHASRWGSRIKNPTYVSQS